MVLLDEYERKARLIPGLLTVLPVAILIASLGWREQPVIASVAGLLAALGGPFVIASAVRARGLAIQPTLFMGWNGAPTTHALRWVDPEWSEAQRQQWRKAASKVTGSSFPRSAEEETSGSESADGRYETAVAALRSMTRDRKRFPFVAMENRNFGYERNLLAMRPVGLVIASAAFLILAALAVVRGLNHVMGLALQSLGIGAGVCLLIVIFWLIVPSRSRAWLVGRRYAERLMDSAIDLSRKGAA